jgi:hypothetical protein
LELWPLAYCRIKNGGEKAAIAAEDQRRVNSWRLGPGLRPKASLDSEAGFPYSSMVRAYLRFDSLGFTSSL